ncbi:tail length tape measure protein [Vibrio phage K251 g3]
MDDLARLQIRIESVEADVAEGRLGKLAKTGAKAERATDGLMGSFKRFAGPAAIAAAAIAGFTKTVQITRQFDVLNAQLITATGSAKNAAIAFEAIQDFATQTPYDLQQATEGFTKLVNLGLTPSERAMRSYGDTASAMGKDMIQMVEAVADATTGEFERLKEFGIRSKKNGDEVAFTFRGVTETVKFNSKEIEEYLTSLGENNFAGAMEQRMQTLDGALSNLGDSWNKLFLTVSEEGVGGIVEDGVREAIGAIEDLTAMISSGEMYAYLDAFEAGWGGVFDSVAQAIDVVSQYVQDTFIAWGDGADSAGESMVDAFMNMPANIKAGFQIISVEIEAMLQKLDAFDRAATAAVNPFSDYSAAEAWDWYEKRVEEVEASVSRAYAGINTERKKATSVVKDEIDRAKELRKAYDEANEARKSEGGDRLAQFRTGVDQKGPTDEEVKAAAKKKALRDREMEQLVESLRTEEERIQQSYDKRLAIILQNTEEGSIKQQELKERLDQQFATESLGMFAADVTYEDQLTTIQEEFDRKRALILENTQLTEDQRTELELELTRKRNDMLNAMEAERTSFMLNAGSQTFDALAGMAKQFAGEQSSLYKVMFAASKAVAIADSVVKIQQGIANAASLPWPANLGAIASTAAASANVVSTISSTNYAGAFDKGGEIPSGKFGLVGENGPELVEGPVRVTSRRETADKFRQADADKNTKDVQNSQEPVNISMQPVMVLDSAVLSDFVSSAEGEAAILEVVNRNRVA